ncbi:phospholipase [Desulfuribacillus alkaliarsenatis]|uniref:phospholipase n=1 Tax=Desulfuribacillus alkaliarsenatis TaxID=766136 RepID=UPI000A003411
MRGKRTNLPSFKFCVFPGYRWCGPGCSGPGRPINVVDAICREHDICYKKSCSRCECDLLFLRRLKPLINLHTTIGRHALLIYLYMRIQVIFTCRGVIPQTK